MYFNSYLQEIYVITKEMEKETFLQREFISFFY